MNISIHNNIAKTNTMKRIVNWAAPKGANEGVKVPYDILQKNWTAIFMLTTMGIGQTAMILKSDDMPKERRIPLALNNIITCAIALVGGLLTDKHTEKLKDRIFKRAESVFAKDSAKLSKMQNGIKTTVPLVISTFLYKYIGQVIATPLTDKVNKYMVKHEMVDYSKD